MKYLGVFTLSVSRVRRDQNGEEVVMVDKEKTLPVEVDVEGPIAKVGMSFGQTIQVRQFEPVKVEVWVELPCNLQDIHTQAARCSQLVSEIVSPEIEEILKQKEENRRLRQS